MQVHHAIAQEAVGVLVAQQRPELLRRLDPQLPGVRLGLLQQQVHHLHVARRLLREDEGPG